MSSCRLKSFIAKDFVQIEGYQEMEKRLSEVGILSLIGSPGSGKTTLGWILMKHICERENRHPLILTKPSEIDHIPVLEDWGNKNTKDRYVVLIDDMFGKTNLDKSEKESWEKQFPKIRSLITYGIVKVLITLRTQIHSQCEKSSTMKEYRAFLKFTHLSLTVSDKKNILEHHLKTNKKIIMDGNDKNMAVRQTFEELGFAQCCVFWIRSTEAQKRGVDFFKKPIEYLKREFDQIKSDNPLQYLVLLLVMFKQGILRPECLDPFKDDKDTRNLIKKLKDVCGINSKVTLEEMKRSANSLCGVYLVYNGDDDDDVVYSSDDDDDFVYYGDDDDDVVYISDDDDEFVYNGDGNHNSLKNGYSFIHQSVFDTLFLQFSSEYFEQSIMICPAPVLVEYVVTPGVSNQGDLTLMVRKKNYTILAKRFTELLTNADSVRVTLSHPSFKDEQFVEYLITHFWNSEILRNILSMKLYTKVGKRVEMINQDKVNKIWSMAVSKFVLWEHTVTVTVTTATLASIAVNNNASKLSNYFASNLVKLNSSSKLQQELLKTACLKGNTEVVHILLKGGVVPTNDTFTAAAGSNTDSVSILINLFEKKNDLDIDNLGHLLFLALHEANEQISHLLIDKIGAIQNHVRVLDEAVKRLLIGLVNKYGWLFNVKEFKPEAATNLFRHLHTYSKVCTCSFAIALAVQYKYASILKEIININPSLPTIVTKGKTLLHLTARSGCLESLNIVLHHGLAINTVNSDKETAIRGTASYFQCDIVRALVDKEAELDVADDELNTPIHNAAQRNSQEMVTYLVLLGADVNKQNESGDTPLHCAAQHNSLEIFATKKSVTDANQRSLEVVTYLVKQGADVNKQNKSGHTPLHYAAKHNSLEMVTYLVSQGAEVNKQNKSRDTPLHCAAQHNSLEIPIFLAAKKSMAYANQRSLEMVTYLVKQGAEVNKQNKSGDTPLHYAAQHNSLEMVTYLVLQGAEVNKEHKSGNTPLHYAALHNSLEMVTYLVSRGADVNKQNESGHTPLHYAAKHNSLDIPRFNPTKYSITGANQRSLEMVTYLVKHGADVNKQNKSGDTPLHNAAQRSSLEMVTYLVLQGADVNKQNESGHTPLNCAAQHNSLEIASFPLTKTSMADANQRSLEVVTYLVLQGAEVNTNIIGSTPLHYAVQRRSPEMVTYLVKHGADVNKQNKSGDTPLHNAAQRSSLEMVTYLVKHGADVNKQNKSGDTPLHYAAQHNSLEMVTYLVKHGAEVNKQNKSGDTPLHYAAQNNFLEMVTYLVSQGADVNKQNESGDTPLHYAAKNNSLEMVTYLVSQGAEVNKQNESRDTPLHCAAQHNSLDIPIFLAAKKSMAYANQRSLEMVTYLVKQGADANKQNESGDTPLHYAAQHNSLEMVTYLVLQGADVNKQNESGDTPLHYAAQHNSLEMVTYLVLQGADVNKENKSGDTPLHYAAQRNSLEMVTYLVLQGADANIQNKSGDTPLHYAAQHNSLEMVTYLVLQGADVNKENKSGDTPLHYAAQRNSLEMVTYLVSQGAHVNTQNESGEIPLHCAAVFSTMIMVNFMVENGAVVDCENNNKYTPLILACLCNKIDNVICLLEKGADPNHGNITAMHAAATSHSTDVLQLLLDRGTDVNVLTESGNSPLHMAVRWRFKCVINKYFVKHYKVCINYMLCDNLFNKSDKSYFLKIINLHDDHSESDEWETYDDHAGDWLLDHGCCIDARNQAGQTALHVCVQCDELENLKFLLNSGADMSCVDTEGNSVLHYAVERFQVEAVETLLESGAVDSKNNDGITAFDLASRKMNLSLDEENRSKCSEIIKLLSN